jgi:RNA polymerase sigma factor (sigma-70 family)
MAAAQFTPVLQFLCRYGGAADGIDLTDGQLLERFLHQGDETAFTTLLRRHGPMVLGVCRRVLRDRHEAEDAFQATFLLLVRKAGSLRQPDRLGPWLHGVAYRTALKAKARAARRPACEQSLEDWPAPASPNDLVWRDLRSALDDAIRRLPSKYRVPVVLCYLEGMTNAQAARHLGCPPGTIATRLARARAQLRVRLARQGVTLSAGVLTMALAEGTATARVSPPLFAAVARLAAAFRAGTGVVASVEVVTLMKGVWTSMLMDKLKVLALVLGTVAAAGLGVGLATFPALGEEPAAPSVEAVTAPTAPPMAQAIPVSQTPNFRVEAPTRRIAQLVAEAAERQRLTSARRWLGRELPPWPEPCPIQVKIAPDRPHGSATSFQFERGKVKAQRMVLEGSLENLLANALPHEVTHTVLAHHFGAPIPRWADEGAALLSEDEEEQQRYERHARQILNTPDRAIPLRRLLALRDYPTDVMALFAEGYSLTRFLVGQQDRRTFLAFVKQGGRDGWDKAVQTHYHFPDVGALEKAWLTSLNLDRSPLNSPQGGELREDRNLGSDVGLAPVMALAVLGKEGRIVVRWPEHYYEPRERAGQINPTGDYRVVTIYEQVNTYASRSVEAREVRAYGTDGQPIEPKALEERLRKPTPVLVAQDGRPVSAFYLQVIKEGTVILVVPPALKVPPPPSVPAPAIPEYQPPTVLPPSRVPDAGR